MQPNRRYTLLSLLAAFLILPLLAGCAGMPLQEMSDARQAIRAAERAGAATHAPEPLAEAKQLVEQARSSMQKREYREARDDAEHARERAMEARRLAEVAAAPPAAP
jgi:type II secretory pathway component PulJ